MTGKHSTIRAAAPGEAAALSELALRSKAMWPYSAEFIAACKEELTYSERQLRDPQWLFLVLADAGQISGFVALDLRPADHAEVLALFVDPAFVRRGCGAKLWHAAVQSARERGVETLQIASDPYAEAFYAKMGARRIGEIPSGSIAGRVLPLMRCALTD